MVRINVKDLYFGYSIEKHTLKAINFEVEAGDMLAIIGQNGSGKSTLLKCMNRILNVKKGIIEINGKSIRSMSHNTLAKNIAYVPQVTQIAQNMSVFDAVLMGRKPYIHTHPSQRDLEIVSLLLIRMELEQIAMRDINTLSGGQQQRVLIARALAQDPSIMLLDEPIANLDINHQIKVLQLLKQLTQEGISVVITIHDINMAVRFCNKALMLKEGEVFASGLQSVYTPENIEKLYDIPVDIVHHGDSICIIPQNR